MHEVFYNSLPAGYITDYRGGKVTRTDLETQRPTSYEPPSCSRPSNRGSLNALLSVLHASHRLALICWLPLSSPTLLVITFLSVF